MRCLGCGSSLPRPTPPVCDRCGIHIATSRRDLLPDGKALSNGKYVIQDVAGRGSFGVTYQALETGSGRTVAVKEFFPHDFSTRAPGSTWIEALPESVQKFRAHYSSFRDEARTLEEIRHDHVVQVFGDFTENGTAYIVMEWLSGVTLREELDRRADKRFSYAESQVWFAQAVSALSAIHSRNVLHLDLKPDNILLCNDRTRLVLADFGAAKHLNEKAKVEGNVSFALAYAAPEVLTGEPKGPFSDIFSLGMVVHEALAGSLAPSAMSRLYNDTFRGASFQTPWNFLVNRALTMDARIRPAQARLWWDSVFAPPKRRSGEWP